MKKKTIVFLCLALIFLFSIPESFSGSVGAGFIAIALCGLFAFLAYRSFNASKKDTPVINDNSGCTPPEQKFVSQPVSNAAQ